MYLRPPHARAVLTCLTLAAGAPASLPYQQPPDTTRRAAPKPQTYRQLAEGVKEPAHPVESIGAFEKLPNTTQSDIDAKERTPSKGVTYVKLGDSARPAGRRE